MSWFLYWVYWVVCFSALNYSNIHSSPRLEHLPYLHLFPNIHNIRGTLSLCSTYIVSICVVAICWDAMRAVARSTCGHKTLASIYVIVALLDHYAGNFGRLLSAVCRAIDLNTLDRGAIDTGLIAITSFRTVTQGSYSLSLQRYLLVCLYFATFVQPQHFR